LHLIIICNFNLSEGIAYHSDRKFNDLRKDISHKLLKLIAIFVVTSTGSNSGMMTIKRALNRFVHKGITHSYRFHRTNLDYLEPRCQRRTSNCDIKIQRNFSISLRTSEHMEHTVFFVKNMSYLLTTTKLIKKKPLVTRDICTKTYKHIFMSSIQPYLKNIFNA
jgi:hypothetical protein